MLKFVYLAFIFEEFKLPSLTLLNLKPGWLNFNNLIAMQNCILFKMFACSIFLFFVRCLPRRINPTDMFLSQMIVLVGKFTLDQQGLALTRHTPTFNWEVFPLRKKWGCILTKNSRALCTWFLTPRWSMSSSSLSEALIKACFQTSVPPSPMNLYQLPILR